MKRLGTKTVSLSSIKGSWRARAAAAKADPQHPLHRLAASIDETDGPLQVPMVNAQTMEPVYGEDRLAACLLLGRKRTEVQFAEGTELDLELAKSDENLFRRGYEPGQLSEMTVHRVELLEARAQQRAAQLLGQPSGKRGRPKTPRGEAIDEAAATEDVEPDTIRKRLQRHETAPTPDTPLKALKRALGFCRRMMNAIGEAAALGGHVDHLVDHCEAMRRWIDFAVSAGCAPAPPEPMLEVNTDE